MGSPPAQDQTVSLDDLYTALGVVTAEVTHEVTHTLAFLQQLAECDISHDQEGVAFARKEIARIQRLLSNLRRFKLIAPQVEMVGLINVLDQALAKIKRPTTSRLLIDHEAIPTSLTVRGDPNFITRALQNLLEHALHSAGPDGEFGLRAVPPIERGKTAVLVVWDNGPLNSTSTRTTLFLPWASASDTDHPLRMAIAHGLIRGLGWSLDYERVTDRNEYRITVPATDLGAAR
jgi:signal transduction histidine kinase